LDLPERPVPHGASVRAAVVLLGGHDGEHGRRGLVLVPTLFQLRLQQLRLRPAVPVDLGGGRAAERGARQVELPALGGVGRGGHDGRQRGFKQDGEGDRLLLDLGSALLDVADEIAVVAVVRGVQDTQVVAAVLTVKFNTESVKKWVF
jgi:hypothetical protein